MIKMTQEDLFKLEIRESQSLAKPRLRGRSRKKGKEANRDRDNIIKKKQTKQISKHDKYSSVLSLSPGGGGTLQISWWGCAAWTLEPLTYNRASSAEVCYPVLE